MLVLPKCFQLSRLCTTNLNCNGGLLLWQRQLAHGIAHSIYLVVEMHEANMCDREECSGVDMDICEGWVT